jgi:hypothetical protein
MGGKSPARSATAASPIESGISASGKSQSARLFEDVITSIVKIGMAFVCENV